LHCGKAKNKQMSISNLLSSSSYNLR
jgi:hypothetical protein